MAHPIYIHPETGKRLPSVTTIIGRFKESGGLIHWAWDLGLQKKDYRTERDKAASTGSYGHDLIECHIRGFDAPDPMASGLTGSQIEQAEKGFESYLKWEKGSNLEIFDTEVRLVCPEYNFGGMADAVGLVDGVGSVPDWKTSNKTYGEYAIQVAAYRHLLNHGVLLEGGGEPPTRGVEIKDGHLLRIGKDFAEFHHSYWGEDVLDFCWGVFKKMLSLYDDLKLVKRLA